MYTKAFEKAFLFILKWEGGYVNDPNDPGGETKYGISRRAYPNLNIKDLTIEDAKKIYYEDYWLNGHCDRIEFYSEKLAFLHFNYCVNTGLKRAAIFLQKAIKRNGFDIPVDGIIGPKTLQSLMECHRELTYEAYHNQAVSFYVKLVQRKRNLRIYLRGWLNRAIDAYEYGLHEFTN